MLSLRPFVRRTNPVLGALRLGAFFFMTTMMFSVFAIALPLRCLVRTLSVLDHPTSLDAHGHTMRPTVFGVRQIEKRMPFEYRFLATRLFDGFFCLFIR